MKYSIIIPTRNRVEYLKYAIDSVLSQNYFDYELIISNNHSSDQTELYLTNLHHPCVKILKPESSLSMTKHFEFAIRQATGDWISVLGDDDALQPYFFELLDLIIHQYPDQKIINGKRAYYFWEGSSKFYNGRVVTFESEPKLQIVQSSTMMQKLLYSDVAYFEAPQFYTGTVFCKSYLDEILLQQHGTIFTSSIPDANSTAIILRTCKEYVLSKIPLTWIGTSPKSNGLNHFNIKNSEGHNTTISDFNLLNTKDKLYSYSGIAHLLDVPDMKCYFLESLFQSDIFYNDKYEILVIKNMKRYFIFMSIFNHSRQNIRKDNKLKEIYDKIFKEVNINRKLMICLYVIIFPLLSLKSFILKLRLFIKFNVLSRISPQYARLRSNDYTSFPDILKASDFSINYFNKGHLIDHFKRNNL